MSDTRLAALAGRGAVSGFTTLREGSLHAALKARYAATVAGARVEAAVDGFIVDVAGRHELVENQTASFGSARRKLERLVASRRVVLVHPIPIETWLVRVDADGVAGCLARPEGRGHVRTTTTGWCNSATGWRSESPANLRIRAADRPTSS